MRFKDFKTEAPVAPAPKQKTFTQQLTDPDKKPSLWSKTKDAWKSGQKFAKTGAGNKAAPNAGAILKSIGQIGKDVKGLVKGDGDAKAEVNPKKTSEPQTGPGEPTQTAAKPKQFSTKKILGPEEVRGGSAFVNAQDGATYTYDAGSKTWIANDKTKRPISRDKGIDIFNLAKQRTKVEESKQNIKEAEARIQHAEDLVFFQGSAGAKRALGQLKELASGGQGKVTIKWDGSPAVIFGRDEDGKFMLTDKGGFGAKGYDGKNKSPEAVEKMFLARPGAQKNPDGFKALAANMKKAYSVMEKATPKDFRGYFKGDMLYFNTPNKEQDVYMFKPQIVQYMVKADSKIGKRIGQSSVGVVIHRVVDENGNESPLKEFDMFQGNELFVIPPVTVSEAPKVDETSLNKLEALINKNASSIDSFLDKNKLAQMKVSDFSNILYTYTNSKVDTGLDNLGRDFLKWLSNSKVSKPKQERLIKYIKENVNTFSAIWDTVNGIMKVKDNIISQLDTQDSDVVATINGQPGGEGYVLSDPTGDMKLVNRRGFSAANRAQMR